MMRLFWAAFVCIIVSETVFAQSVQFRVPLFLQWGTKKDTVYVGVNGGNGSAISPSSYGLDQVTTGQYGPLGVYGEAGSPPPDAEGNRVRFIDLPGRTQLSQAGGLFRYDYRGYQSPTQADTFVIEVTGAVVEANDLTVSWPDSISRHGTGWTINSRTPASIGGVVKEMLVAPFSHTFAATGNPQRFAVIKVGATTVSVGRTGIQIPSEFRLGQNFPNPFNPTTSIRFDLPASGQVNLRVFNLLGQQVAELANGALAAGSYAVTFDGKDLASGVYLFRLDAGGATATRKMVLLR